MQQMHGVQIFAGDVPHSVNQVNIEVLKHCGIFFIFL